MCIDANTTVRCTGRNSAGQLGQGVASDPNVDPYVAKSVVAQRYHSAPLTGVVSLAAGVPHLRPDLGWQNDLLGSGSAQ